MAADKNSSISREGYPSSPDNALRAAADWQQARLTRQLHWAEIEAAHSANREPVHTVSKAAAEAARKDMKRAMASLEADWPSSVIGARMVMNVVADILALREAEPENDWHEGDTRKLIINVRSALDYLDGAMPIGPTAYDEENHGRP